MLKKLSTRQVLQNLAIEWEESLSREWLDAIRRITSAVVLRDLIAELERGNLEAAMRMLDIQPERFARFERGLLDAWNAGGQATVNAMPMLRDPSGQAIIMAWGARNVPAEQIMRNYAAAYVDGLVDEQLSNMRFVLSDGLARGQNPSRTARRVIGAKNVRTGVYEGGLIGHSLSQTQTLNRLYFGLMTGDRDVMRGYLDYRLRNKNFDGHVIRALEGGGHVPADAVNRIVTFYGNKVLTERAKIVAHTETNSALARAQDDAYRQQIDNGRLLPGEVTKSWGRTISREPRVEHLEMARREPIPFDQPFVLPDGTECQYPHDPSLPAKHRVNCKCPMPEYQIDFLARGLRRYRERTGG